MGGADTSITTRSNSNSNNGVFGEVYQSRNNAAAAAAGTSMSITVIRVGAATTAAADYEELNILELRGNLPINRFGMIGKNENNLVTNL